MKTFKPKKTLIAQAFVGLLVYLVILCIARLIENATPSIPTPQADRPPALYAHETQTDLRNVFASGIKGAKQSILLIIYSLTDPTIIDSLQQQAHLGVDVCVICDAKASPGVRSRLGPKITVHKRISGGLMHQKILVVDKAIVWIGSANMTTESLQLHGNLVTTFHCPEMASVITEKALSLSDDDGNEKTFPHQIFNVFGQPTELCFFPDDSQGVSRLLRLIQTAEKTVRVAMFTWTRQDLVEAVSEAKLRGVDVEVVLDYHSGKGTSSKVAKMLHKNGVPTFLGQGNGLLHHKFLYVDGKTLVNGSANWTKAAFTKNDDCYIILHDLTDQQKQFMDTLWMTIVADSVPFAK